MASKRTCGLLGAILLGIGLAAQALPASAQSYPNRAVRIIVGFAPGGGTDTLARLIGPRLSEMWKQPVVIENRAGADGSIAAAAVAQMPPDGYTLAMVSNAHTITPSEYKLPYDPIKSFTPVTEVAYVPDILLVNPSLPVNSIDELIALAKAKPGTLNYGSSGSGTGPYLEMRLLSKMAGIDLVHVPYKGSAPAVVALLSGEVQLMFGAVSTTLEQVRGGKLRALGISSAEPSPAAPDIQPVGKVLPGFESSVWYGLLAPAGTPAAVAEKVSADIRAVLAMPEVKDRLAGLGFTIVANTPEQFTGIIASDIKRWSALLGAAPK
jgi:tripartite-type tricarboxylate transporter receptor subunit TctC